ncbi:MAG: DUF1905 domain-containing protein [Cyclobacteriaceae bacterium]|nr:DUF1905 domain-containing protein [Cyclobacteriaceae bacterium]
MITYSATIKKFDKQGEKTGWTYIEISATQAKKLKDSKVSFRVRGTLDAYQLEKAALLPMGDGNFILPINATIRKATGKRQGDKLKVLLEADDRKFIISPDLIACLNDDPMAYSNFKKLPGSHQRYFSKWVDSAKTSATKTKRIIMAVTALAKNQGYGEMIRANRSS